VTPKKTSAGPKSFSLPVAVLILFHSAAEVSAMRTVFFLIFDPADKITAEEQKEVQQRSDDGAAGRPVANDQLQDKQRPVHIGQILHLDGEEEKQQHLMVGEQKGKSQKQRQIQIGAGAVAGQKRRDNGADHAHQVVQIEPEGAPYVFQRASEKIIEVDEEKQGDDIAGRRYKDKGQKPPELSLQRRLGVQRQIAGQADLLHRKDHIADKHRCDGHRNIQHQIGDGKPPHLPLQFVEPVHTDSSTRFTGNALTDILP